MILVKIHLHGDLTRTAKRFKGERGTCRIQAATLRRIGVCDASSLVRGLLSWLKEHPFCSAVGHCSSFFREGDAQVWFLPAQPGKGRCRQGVQTIQVPLRSVADLP